MTLSNFKKGDIVTPSSHWLNDRKAWHMKGRVIMQIVEVYTSTCGVEFITGYDYVNSRWPDTPKKGSQWDNYYLTYTDLNLDDKSDTKNVAKLISL